MATWREDHDAMVREHGVGVPLCGDAMTVLDDVQAAIADAGALGWPTPTSIIRTVMRTGGSPHPSASPPSSPGPRPGAKC